MFERWRILQFTEYFREVTGNHRLLCLLRPGVATQLISIQILLLNPVLKLVIPTAGLIPLAQVDILAIVRNLHRRFTARIELQHDIRCKIWSRLTVQILLG